jgi:diguanylate cyclase (GGDEF)-like protein/PAS domain S-box-containing protein
MRYRQRPRAQATSKLGDPDRIPPVSSERRFRALFDTLPQMLGLIDAAAIVRYANDKWCAYTGAPVDEEGVPQPNLLVSADDSLATAIIFEAIDGHRGVRCNLAIVGADGISRRFEVSIAPLETLDETPALWMFSCIDIEAQRIALAGLQALNSRVDLIAEGEREIATRLGESSRLPAIVEHMTHVGHWRLDLLTNELAWADGLYRTFGLRKTQKPTLESMLDSFHADDRESMRAILQEAIVESTPFTRAARVVRPSGVLRHVVAYGQPECAADGSVIAFVGCLQDVTASKVARRERERLSERASLATQAAQVGIWEWDIRSGAVDWDATMFGVFGLDRAAGPATYERWAASLHPKDRAGAERELALAASSGTPFDTEFRVVWPNGEVRNIRALAVVIRDEDGLAERVVGTNWDITAERNLADELRRQKDAAAIAACHDALTGLLNRRGFEGWLASRQEAHATLLYLDIDGFKAVNDGGGHAAGDETLRDLARIIKESVRACDACARMGGDEFVIVLPGRIDNEATMKIFARITSAVDVLRPLGPNDATRIGMSIGIGHLGGAASSEDALRQADADLYRCKSERKRLAR